MTNNGIGLSSCAKGLFGGIVVGAAVALLNVPRSGRGFRSDIALQRERFQRQHLPLSETRVEEIDETGILARRSIGWGVVYCIAAAVIIVSDFRLNKT